MSIFTRRSPAAPCHWLLTSLLITLFCFNCQATAQDSLPESQSAKRFGQLLNILNEPNDATRNQLIREAFDGGESEWKNVEKVAKRLQPQFGGVSFHKEVSNTESEYSAACLTKRGFMILAGVEISEVSGLIVDVSIEEYEANEKLTPIANYLPILVDGVSNPQVRGVWQARGYGYILEVTENELNAYNYSGNFGWEIEFYDNMLFKTLETDSSGQPTVQATLHHLEPGYKLTKLNKLPEACLKKNWTPIELFDAYADIMNVHYPFFEERNIDWPARISKCRPKVTNDSTEEELFEAISATLENLQDGHVSLSAVIEGKSRSANVGKKGTALLLQKAFGNQSEFESRAAFFSKFTNDLKTTIKESLLQGNGGVECNDKLIWGRVKPHVGYIYISAMYGYGAGSMTEQVEALHRGMNKILTELADSKAIIIDISMNPGGTDSISIELARHFADRTRIGFSKWPAAVKEYRNDRYVVPITQSSKTGVVYTKPVYILQNDYTASAAEIFTMCMRAFPHVTTIGTPTEGALSDILGKPLPNEWELGISNEIYVDHMGVCHEGPGIPPEIEMRVFQNDIMNHDHAALVKKISKMVLENLGN